MATPSCSGVADRLLPARQASCDLAHNAWGDVGFDDEWLDWASPWITLLVERLINERYPFTGVRQRRRLQESGEIALRCRPRSVHLREGGDAAEAILAEGGREFLLSLFAADCEWTALRRRWTTMHHSSRSPGRRVPHCVRRQERPRGAGRPRPARRRTVRSCAESGDSGDGGDPAPSARLIAGGRPAEHSQGGAR
jgi:hypothetical protein